jgi:HPt (histidine-containing phosphotransfer) domain-containing protein
MIHILDVFSNQQERAKMDEGREKQSVGATSRAPLLLTFDQVVQPAPVKETPLADLEFHSLNEEENGMDDIIMVSVDSDLAALIPDFLQSIRDQIPHLSELLRDDNYVDIQKIGHSLKGVGGGYGFQGITDLGAQIEQSARNSQHDGVEIGIADLQDYLARVKVVNKN